jgi:hypothetical protein
MNPGNRFFLFMLTFILGWTVSSGHAQSIDLESLTPYQQKLVTFILPESGQVVWDDTTTRAFIQEHGTRSCTFHAVGMLLRNQGADRENAQRVIRELLDLQYNTPGESFHGVWRTGLTQDRRDQNWREFVGTGLIVAREYFGDVMDSDLIRDIDAALVRAAEGALERDVTPEYTNIALMSAFLLDYTGHMVSNPTFREAGKRKAGAILDLFSRHNTFTEFNSPTYYGVNLMALGMWRELGKHVELRDGARTIESALWADIAQFYHAGLKNLCGPYTRSYGMDMTRYNALLGMCIAMGLEGPEYAPLPMTRERPFEWAYAPLFALLHVQPPEALLPAFKTFGEPRRLFKRIPYRDRVFQAQALLETDWMMGAATGMLRRWEQLCPGTVHWSATSGGELGWLLVHGENAASVNIKDQSLYIVLPQPEAEHPLRILVHTPEMRPERFGTDTWTLQGMTFDVRTPLAEPAVDIREDEHFGQVIEIAFPVPDTLPTDAPALVLTPRKTP